MNIISYLQSFDLICNNCLLKLYCGLNNTLNLLFENAQSVPSKFLNIVHHTIKSTAFFKLNFWWGFLLYKHIDYSHCEILKLIYDGWSPYKFIQQKVLHMNINIFSCLNNNKNTLLQAFDLHTRSSDLHCILCSFYSLANTVFITGICYINTFFFEVF